MRTVYEDDVAIATMTRECINRGETVFQIHRLAETERAHVHELLAFFDPPQGATIIDIACGVGAVADMMQQERPDLNFILLNQSAPQLSLCSARFPKVQCSCEDIPPLPMLPKIDAAMMQYAMGHVDVRKTMRQIAKLLPRGGVFCLYDLVAESWAQELEDVLRYHASSARDIRDAAYDAGMWLERQSLPQGLYVDHFFNKMAPKAFKRMFANVHPMLFRFVKA